MYLGYFMLRSLTIARNRAIVTNMKEDIRMMIDVTVPVPKPIYDLYAAAARKLTGYSVEEVMSGALQAYAQYLFDEMMASGELQEKS